MRALTLACDDLTPVRAYAALRAASRSDEAAFLFESVVGGERWGRYSILGFRPRYELRLGFEGWKVHGARPPFADNLELATTDYLAAAKVLVEPNPAGSVAERIARSHVGYFAWDLTSLITKVEPWQNVTAPLARLFGGSVIVVFDALAQTMTIAAPDESSLEQTRAALDTASRLPTIALPNRGRIPIDFSVDADDEQYCASVRRAQEYIAAGDAFQVVVARKFTVPARGRDALDVYRAMRLLNPSPYMYILDMPQAGENKGRSQILGASPETLVRLERPAAGGERVMTVRPLAGTRPRGATEEQDRALEAELLADPKERAEHVMLIDLGRNDVGRVATVGSVELARKMEIERYSHVMHIVSEVRGRIADEVSALDVLASAFPAGTLSGAPKLRAMQIIRELELGPRGVYGGAVGYLGHELDFAIAIRTARCENGVFEVTAGAGVVEASVPQAEADETRSKARGVLAAIEAAAQR